MDLRILFWKTRGPSTLLRIHSRHWLLHHVCMPPFVKIMVLQILVRDSTPLNGCAIGVDGFIIPFFLSVGIMMHVMMMALVGTLKGWDVSWNKVLLKRRVMISDTVVVCCG